jgi:hypothetical protein
VGGEKSGEKVIRRQAVFSVRAGVVIRLRFFIFEARVRSIAVPKCTGSNSNCRQMPINISKLLAIYARL